jgi:hypothetical protein
VSDRASEYVVEVCVCMFACVFMYIQRGEEASERARECIVEVCVCVCVFRGARKSVSER